MDIVPKVLQKNGSIFTHFPKYCKKWQIWTYFQNVAKSWSIWTHFPQYCKKWIVLHTSYNAIRDECQHCSPRVELEFVSHPLSISHDFAKDINNNIFTAVFFFSSTTENKLLGCRIAVKWKQIWSPFYRIQSNFICPLQTSLVWNPLRRKKPWWIEILLLHTRGKIAEILSYVSYAMNCIEDT